MRKQNRPAPKSRPTVSSFIDDLNKYCSKYTSVKDSIDDIVSYVRSVTYNLGIGISYEPETPENPISRRRFVLFTQKHKVDYAVPLARYSNGLIFEVYDTTSTPAHVSVRLLCTPTRDLIPSTMGAMKKIQENIKKDWYTIYKIQEGTTINLYYDLYTAAWTISTRRSYDMRDVAWRGQSYGQIIDEIFTKYNFDRDSLDKTQTYTIGFKHPGLHPFEADEGTSCWFISSSGGHTPTLPQQEVVDPQVDIFTLAAGALDAYLGGQRPKVLGYILRTKSEAVSGKFSDIVIESTLLTQIRKLIYQLPTAGKSKHVENFKNFDYVLLESYMDFRRRDMFINLFPQFTPKYEEYDALFRQIIATVYAINVRTEELYKSGNMKKSEVALDIPDNTPMYRLVHYYYPQVQSLITSAPEFSSEDPERIQKLIHDIIVAPKHTERVFSILNERDIL